MLKTSISVVSRFGLAVMWLVSGGLKLQDSMGTYQSVQAYKIFSPAMVDFVATFLPVVEIVLGVMLLVGLFIRTASILTAGIMVAFIAGITSAWVRGLEINCGCFGASETPSNYTWDIVRDSAFLFFAAWGAYFPFTKFAAYKKG